jgi:CPA2 family monovalent cation:H+ antiporter-2
MIVRGPGSRLLLRSAPSLASPTCSSQIMLGTLILQDCALGLLLAVLPALASKDNNPLAIAGSLAREGILLLGFVGVAWLVARMFVPRFLRMLSQLALHDNELYQLGVVAVCLCVALLSEFLGLSLEVGAFVAGLMLSGKNVLKYKRLLTTCLLSTGLGL